MRTWWGMGLFIGALSVTSAQAEAQEINEHRPVISPDGQVVVFMRQSDGTGGDWELFRTDASGRHVDRLTDSEGWDGYAVFSPDGERLVFDRGSKDGDAKQPYFLELATGEVRPLGTYEGWLSVSDWSEESGLLAFWERDGQRDLYLLDPQGGVVRPLTDTPALSEHDAHFSPDGAWIVLASGPADGEGKTSLDVMRSSGADRTTLVQSPDRIYGAAWSPGGDQIAFTDSPDGENGDVFLVEVADGRVERLTEDPAWDHMPVWGPDGDRLLFTSYRSGTERMYWLDLESRAVVHWKVN